MAKAFAAHGVMRDGEKSQVAAAAMSARTDGGGEVKFQKNFQDVFKKSFFILHYRCNMLITVL